MAKRERPSIMCFIDATGHFEPAAEDVENTPHRDKRAKTDRATRRKTRRNTTERPSVSCAQHLRALCPLRLYQGAHATAIPPGAPSRAMGAQRLTLAPHPLAGPRPGPPYLLQGREGHGAQGCAAERPLQRQGELVMPGGRLARRCGGAPERWHGGPALVYGGVLGGCAAITRAARTLHCTTTTTTPSTRGNSGPRPHPAAL